MLPEYIQNACDWANMRGWKVFPTHANEKRPCIKDPFGRATNVREEIIELFAPFPGAGLGIPTGPSNQITVIDVDTKNIDVDYLSFLDRTSCFLRSDHGAGRNFLLLVHIHDCVN